MPAGLLGGSGKKPLRGRERRRHVVRRGTPCRSSTVMMLPTPTWSRNERQRWSALFYDVCSLASAASHDDDITAAFTCPRQDNQAMLAATARLLARVKVVGRLIGPVHTAFSASTR
ncbi:MAG: hypothetical protein ACXVXT_07400 [Blastococcus sp.]